MGAPSQSQPRQPLGQILKEAGLISEAQVQMALRDQQIQEGLLFGEVLVLRGWVKPKTIEFFLDHFMVQSLPSSSLDHSSPRSTGSHPLRAHPLPPGGNSHNSGSHRTPAPAAQAKPSAEDLNQSSAFSKLSPATSPQPKQPLGKSITQPHAIPGFSYGFTKKTGPSQPMTGSLYVAGFCVDDGTDSDQLLEDDETFGYQDLDQN